MRGDEYNGNAPAEFVQMALKLEASHARKIHIEDQASRMRDVFRCQEIFSRSKGIHSKSHGTHEVLERLADRGIVVHDCDAATGDLLPDRRRTFIDGLHVSPIVKALRPGGYPALVGDAYLFRRGQLQLFRHADELGQRLCPHFAHGVTTVRLDGQLAGTELGRDLFVD